MMFARYNAWANEHVYAAAARLTDGDYRADCGAFFGSVHRTLNHLMVADRIWLRRFTGEGPLPKTLDEILYDSLAELTAARRTDDARLTSFVDGLDDGALDRTFSYTPLTQPTLITQPLAPALAHLFNHQTHHRGQVHALLTRLAGDAPSLDLILFQRETGIGLS
jgi:uncharacterized damage-inducible protein DinB